MLKFRYYVRNTEGEPIKGILEATNKDEAISILRSKELVIISIEEERNKINIVEVLWNTKLSVKDLATFCRQLSTMLSAGLPLLRCLAILRKQVESNKLSRVIDKVAEAVQGGESLGNAFRQHQEIPELLVNMIDVGELGGVLEETLSRLATYFEKEYVITEKVKSAVIYPLVVLGVAIGAIVTLMIFVIPSFQQILADLGTDMPLLTRLIVNISNLIVNYWYIIIFANICLAYGINRLFQTEKGRMLKDHILLYMPIYGSLKQKVIVSRFTRTLGTLLKGGVPILTALEVVKKAVSNVVVSEELSQLQINIRNGGGMAETLAQSSVFTPMVIQMVAIGEETGRLDEMLEKVSDYYDVEIDNMVGRLASLLEPMLILFLGGIVGTIILAILLPMFSIIGSI